MQVPPPIETNGSGIVHPSGALGGDVVVVAGAAPVEDTVDAVAMWPGTHPPFTHVPPPIDTKGSGIVHVLAGAATADDGTLVVVEIGADADGVVAAAWPGIHPPSTHVPPPIETNGSGIVQLPVIEDEIAGTSAGTGAGLDRAVGVAGIGIQPPFTHVPPPIETKGSGVVHPGADALTVSRLAPALGAVSPDTLM